MTGTAIPRLSALTAPTAASAGAPPAGIVHLGLGSFHRAHQAVYTRAAVDRDGGDWGILGVASRSGRVVDALREQDLRYTVLEISPDASSCSVPAMHSDAFVAAHDPGRVVTALGDEATRIVSLTVTENGYTYSPATKGLDFDHPDVRHDLDHSNEPRSTIGQIVRGLQRRMTTHGSPVSVLSCDNLAANGHHTRRLTLDFAQSLPGREGLELAEWIRARVTFPSTMVDRIVPATTPHHRGLVAERMGYDDAVPVPAEPFTMWVIEDDFAAGRPGWEAGGAVFSSEVDRYEQMKLRLLNGTHSLIAYLGALSGVATIPESVTQDFVEDAARRVLRAEYLPSVQMPSGVDPLRYEEQLFVRWRNSALGHRTSQVGTDGSVKLRERIPEPALRFRAEGWMPHLLALTTAAYLSCVAPLNDFDPGSNAREMVDPARERLSLLARESRNGGDLARRVLIDGQLLGAELADWDAFAGRVGELIDLIHRSGVRAAADETAALAH